MTAQLRRNNNHNNDSDESDDDAMSKQKIRRKKNQKKVTFSRQEDQICMYDFERKLVEKEYWYTKSEFKTIRFESRVVAQKFRKGQLREGGNQPETYRGLEGFDIEDYKKRLEAADVTLKAVIREQKKQKEVGIYDPEAIANAYGQSGAVDSQRTAIALGRNDRKAARECMKFLDDNFHYGSHHRRGRTARARPLGRSRSSVDSVPSNNNNNEDDNDNKGKQTVRRRLRRFLDRHGTVGVDGVDDRDGAARQPRPARDHSVDSVGSTDSIDFRKKRIDIYGRGGRVKQRGW